jgi:rhodanese-related sulfurtransferase
MVSDLFKNLGIVHGKLLSLSPKEVYELLTAGLIIIDIRDPDYLAFKSFDVGSGRLLNIPEEDFDHQLQHLDQQEYYVVTDSSGIHNQIYAQKMIDKGFRHVTCLSGGFVEWERDGLPIREDKYERLSGSCACQLKPPLKAKG